LKRLGLIIGVLLLFQGSLRAQSTYTWELDPQDAITYRDWTKKEYSNWQKNTIHLAAKTAGHATQDNASTTPAADDTGLPTDNGSSTFWSYHVPQWVKRWAKNPFDSKKSQGGNQRNLAYLWQGLSYYQKAKVTLKSIALVKASLAGMRFEVNAWKLMKNIDVTQYEETFIPQQDQVIEGPSPTDPPSTRKTPPVRKNVPIGAVCFGIVPRGKENWRAVVEYLNDDPQYDGAARSRIRYNGPKSLSDISIEATESGIPYVGYKNDDMENFLETMDRMTRTVAQGIADVRTMVNRRVGQAVRDADSPQRINEKVMQLQERRNKAYNGMIALRAMIEARPVDEVAAEYQGAMQSFVDEARRAYATAEQSANFYQQMAKQADNVVSPLEDPQRVAEIKKLEDAYEKWINKMNTESLIRDIHEFAKYIGTMFHCLTPYVGAVTMPIDFYAMVNGDSIDSAGDDDDESTDIKSELRDAEARIFALRFGYYAWEEMRAWRKLTYLLEQERAAAKGIENDPSDSAVYDAAFERASARNVALMQLRYINAGLEASFAK